MTDREINPEITAEFIAQVGLAHLKKGVDAVGAGKTEIADITLNERVKLC